MKLANGSIRPGKVLEVVDEYGTVKASCAGLFSEEDSTELLPPVYPFMQSSASNFNQPHPNDLIWVLCFTDNPQELFYMFQGNTRGASSHLLSNKPKDAQILSSRESSVGKNQLYYSSEDGWKMESNDSHVQIDKDCNISLSKTDMPNRTISVSEKGISLGTEGESAEPAVLGNKLEDALESIYTAFQTLALGLSSNPMTVDAGAALQEKLPSIVNKISKVKSDNVTLD